MPKGRRAGWLPSAPHRARAGVEHANRVKKGKRAKSGESDTCRTYPRVKILTSVAERPVKRGVVLFSHPEEEVDTAARGRRRPAVSGGPRPPRGGFAAPAGDSLPSFEGSPANGDDHTGGRGGG